MTIATPTRTPAHIPRLTGRRVARHDLTPAQRDAMRALLADHFEGVRPDVFDHDLAAKDWAVLLEDPDGRILGFSTFIIYETEGPVLSLSKGPCPNDRAAIVFSGDTIVDRAAWGTPALARSWIHAVYEVHRARFPGTRLFWFLITSGYRTYRFLPVFWREFHPRFDATMPEPTRDWIRRLACDRFGDHFDPAAGVVRLEHPQPLRGALRDVPAEKRDDPHVAFFLARNPGYVQGDELVCLADLSPENLTPAGRRMVFGSRSSAGG
jgi:hypothetical protein